MPLEALIVLAALVVLLWGVWLEYRARVEEERELAEWQAMFPGRCPVCAYHRYGRHFGHETAEHPAPHPCPEAKC